MTGRLTTHVLDLSQGRPAQGMRVQLWRIGGGSGSEGGPQLLGERRMNGDGRPDRPLSDGERLDPGLYELVFFVGDYFREDGAIGASADAPADGAVFLEQVPVRFRIAESNGHYHVPLLVAPGGYSTYRGS
ncbi:hydroxyisourate hydrolase [Paenibacillus ginsengihumi]|uniref:hydroxyisourate hydrolase n=1 Tax=Paenibacillus ginsengihumi TaxID=431596 RepID=UPI0003609520|nr:hydroxyisourate hydrolase [Paenibacillus ginsengihumi]